MDNWVFIVLTGAAVIHIFEEYVYPGGFQDALKRLLPRAKHLFTQKFHVGVNGFFSVMPGQCLHWKGQSHAEPVRFQSCLHKCFASYSRNHCHEEILPGCYLRLPDLYPPHGLCLLCVSLFKASHIAPSGSFVFIGSSVHGSSHGLCAYPASGSQ